jgi:hypothetical protein
MPEIRAQAVEVAAAMVDTLSAAAGGTTSRTASGAATDAAHATAGCATGRATRDGADNPADGVPVGGAEAPRPRRATPTDRHGVRPVAGDHGGGP